MRDEGFRVGQHYSHDVIIRELKIGNSGGIRVAVSKAGKVSRIVLFSAADQEANPQENPYEDRSNGDILTYTGTGKIGHQNFSGPNLRLSQQASDFFPIYVFSLHSHRKSAGSPDKRWRFSGIYKYLDHSRQNQADLLGLERRAWLFKLLKLGIESAGLSLEEEIARQVKEAFSDPALSAKALLGESASFSAAELDQTVGMMNGLAPFAFELFIKRALIASDFRDVRVTKQSSDRGVDVIARMPSSVWLMDTQLIQIQAKRWARPVGRREVAELRGSLFPSAVGVMISTGGYAKAAIIEAGRPNLLPISLVDGHKLAEVVMRMKLEIL